MNRMRELRLEKGLNMKDAAKSLNLPYTTYVNYEKGLREPNSEKLIDIANFYNTSIDYLLGKSNIRIDERTLDTVNDIDLDLLMGAGNIKDALHLQKERNAVAENSNYLPPGAMPIVPGTPIPVLGSVRCGLPMYAEENILGYVPYLGVKGEEYFALQAVGDSMNAAGIQDGDILIVRKQDYVDPGTIAVVCVNGDEATVKRFRQEGSTIILSPQSTNDENQVQVYDLSVTPVHIMGRVMEVRHSL